MGARLSVFVPDSSDHLFYRFDSGLTTPALFTVSHQAEWEAVWAQVASPYRPPPALPDVNFTAKRVLVAASGAHGTCGFVILIDSVVSYEAAEVAYVTMLEPGNQCGVTLAESEPVDIVRVPFVPSQPFTFQTRTVAPDCF